jgi:signal transduction histidine kinase
VLDLSQGKSIRLLVIEGDEQLTAQIYAYVEPLGYVLDSASNGMLGWQRAVSEAYDALLIDVMLPGMDGLTLCRRVRTESGSEIPVIMMTSSESVENRVLCLNWGADDFLVKPFDFLEMEARIRAVVRRARIQHSSRVLRWSGLELDPQTQRGMKIIHGETHRLTEMVVELLDFTRIEDGRFTLNVEISDIRGVFEDTVYMYGSRLAQEGIRLELMDSDQDIPEIPCDPQRMRQVFLNILDNAAKHGGDGKRIEASMEMEEDEVVVRIRDHGPGIPEEELPLVKKKFYKGSTKVRGTGIGLAVCDEIIALHSGELTLENAPDGGTIVTVRLPVTQ